MSKKRIFIILAVVAVVSLLAVQFLKPNRSNNLNVVDHGHGELIFGNTEFLDDVMIQEKADVTITKLTQYIEENIDAETEYAYIESKPAAGPDGKISFTVKTEKPDKQFVAVVEPTSNENVIIVAVRGSDFRQIVNIYKL